MADFEVDYALDGVTLGLSVGWVLVAELAPLRPPEAPVGQGRRGDWLDEPLDTHLERRAGGGGLGAFARVAGGSDAVAAGALALPAAYAGGRVAMLGAPAARSSVEHAVIAWEGGLVALALAEAAKVGADAERPYVVMCGDDAACYEQLGVGGVVVADGEDGLLLHSEARSSFFSGHTAAVGGTTFALAHVVALGGDGRPGVLRVALPYASALALTTTVAVLRVESARHYPTDVLTGGVVGAAVGIAVAEWHRLPGRVSATPVSGGAILAWAGAW